MTIDVSVLQTLWATWTWIGVLGLVWHTWLWSRALYWSRRARRERWHPADRAAQDAQRLTTTYRLVVKLAFTGYALFRWDILLGATPSVLDWRQGMDAGLFGVGLLVLTAWSAHSYWLVHRAVVTGDTREPEVGGGQSHVGFR